MPSALRTLLLGAVLAAAQEEDTTEVTAADLEELAAEASTLADEVCIDAEVDREAAEDALRGFALANEEGKSLLRQILDEANEKEEADLVGAATTKIQGEITSPAFLGAAVGVPLAVIMIVIWFFCCWQWWPCCRCCRCCKKDRGTANSPTKFVVLVATATGVIGCLVAAGIGMGGASDIVAGIDLALCGAAQLSATTLNGSPAGAENRFTGLVPLLNEMDSLLSDTLAEGSDFLTGLNDILDLTLPIEAATTNLADTVTMASQALGDARNRKPKPAGVPKAAPVAPRSANDLGHYCKMCEATSGPLAEVAAALKDSTGTALAEQREVIADKLQGSELDNVRAQLEEAKAPLSDFRSTIYTTFNPLVGADAGTGEAAKAGQEAINLGALLLILLVLVFPLVFTLLAVLYCLCRQTSGDGERYNAMPRRFAACAWCCSFLFAFIAFLFGGILSIVAVPVSGLCLFLINVDGELLTEQKALGFGTDPEQDQMIADSFDKCFADDGDGRILDVMKFDRCPNGTEANPAAETDSEALPCAEVNGTEEFEYERVSAEQFLKDEIAGQLSGAFDQIRSLNLTIETKSNPEFASLLGLFADYDVAAFYQVDENAPFDQDPRYVMMNVDSRSKDPEPVSNGMAYCSFTSIKCAAQPTQEGDAVDDLATELELEELPGYNDCLRLAASFTVDHVTDKDAAERTGTTVSNCGATPDLSCEVPDITPAGTSSQAFEVLAACKGAVENMADGHETFVAEIDNALTKLTAGTYATANDAELMQLWNMNGERAGAGDGTEEFTCHPCQAAKNWLAVKDEITGLNGGAGADFTCYYFRKDGVKCDPMDTTRVDDANGDLQGWTNDCMVEYTNAKGVKKYRSEIMSEVCTYAEWVQWYTDMETRLEKAADRVDAEVGIVGQRILEEMQGLVDDNLIQPVLDMIDGMNCAFIGENFGTLLDGMCRKMVPGVGAIGQSYVALGVLLWVVVITLNFAIWRYVADNIYVSNQDNATE